MPLDDYDDTISDNDDEQENMYPSSQRQVRHNRGNLIVNNSIIYSSPPPPVEPSINKRSSSRVTDPTTEIFDNGLSKTSTLPPSAPPVSDHERDSSPDLLIQSREVNEREQAMDKYLNMGKNTYAEDDEVCIRRSSKRTKVSVVEKGIAVL